MMTVTGSAAIVPYAGGMAARLTFRDLRLAPAPRVVSAAPAAPTFADAVADATPLRATTLAPLPRPARRPRVPAPVLPPPITLHVERGSDRLHARAPALRAGDLRALARGEVRVEQTFDLHGTRASAVARVLGGHLLAAQRDVRRCVLGVHGHGAHAQGRSVLRDAVHLALVDELSGLVLGCATAMPKDGGPGSTYVMVRT